MKKLFENWRSFVNEQDESEDTEEKQQSQIKILIFGHSQTSELRVGGAQKDILVSNGIPEKNIILKVRGGLNDAGLVTKIKEIKGKFTHAILHLDGNYTKLPGCIASPRGVKRCSELGEAKYQQEKTFIINYVKNNLNVPEKNILIFTPPINKDYGRGGRLYRTRRGPMGKNSYKIRGIGHQRAVAFFRQNFPEAQVPDVIEAEGEAFSDHLHMRKSGAGVAANYAINKILEENE